jgi:exosome complex component CSL4
MQDKKEPVVPGEALAYAVEYVGGNNTIELEDGMLYPERVGIKEVNEEDRSVKVTAKKEARIVKPGDLVYGKVYKIFSQMTLVEFQPVEKGLGGERTFAYLRVSELDKGYAESIRDYLRTGDYLKARVKEVKPLGIYLTMREDDLGVVRAFCSRCRHELNEDGKCPECGRHETRKWAGKRFEKPRRRFDRRGGRPPRRDNYRDRRPRGNRRRN